MPGEAKAGFCCLDVRAELAAGPAANLLENRSGGSSGHLASPHLDAGTANVLTIFERILRESQACRPKLPIRYMRGSWLSAPSLPELRDPVGVGGGGHPAFRLHIVVQGQCQHVSS